jgi:hypothetical protein
VQQQQRVESVGEVLSNMAMAAEMVYTKHRRPGETNTDTCKRLEAEGIFDSEFIAAVRLVRFGKIQ